MKRSLIVEDRLDASKLGPRSDGKRKKSTARSDGKRKKSTARSDGKMKRSTARSDGKRKSSLKDEPIEGGRAKNCFLSDGKIVRKRSTPSSSGKRKKSVEDDPIIKQIYVPRFYRSGWSMTTHSTEIPMPRLMKLAAKVVASYNKRKGLDFELVEAIKGFSLLRDDTTFDHLNFKAKLKDSKPSDVKLFFGELVNGKSPTCYLIDPNTPGDYFTACDMCNDKEGQVLLHPDDMTRSMCAPPSSHEIHREPPLAPTAYECELIKAGGSEEKAKKAYREYLLKAHYAMPGVLPC